MNRYIVTSLLIIITAISVNYIVFVGIPPCAIESASMSEFDKLSYQMLSDMNKYLTSLATLVLGGLGAMAMKIHTIVNIQARTTIRDIVIASGCFGIASLYFSFDSHIRLTEASINHCTSFENKLMVAQTLQFTALAICLIGGLLSSYKFVLYDRDN